MQLRTTYRQIFSISAPIMLGATAQNIIALTDGVFLYHLSESDFAAIGFVGAFYLTIAAIGFGFSRGGQILIARRMGEGRPDQVGRTFYAMLYFELGLALAMFLFMQFGDYYFFSLFANSDVIFYKTLEYLDYRSWGVFFSYAGVAIVALYTGVARPKFILVDTIILVIVNIILNYALIYGKWGLPEMGISGAGLASTIAEIVAFVVFIVYMFFDRYSESYRLFKLPEIDWELIKEQYKIAFPMVAQSIIGIGSWFVFLAIVENLGERELAITNLVRMVYLMLSVPCWGFGAGVNTLVSNFMGQGKKELIFPILWKTTKICLVSTLLISLPVIIFPKQILYPILGSQDMSLITEAQPIFYVLFVILILFTIAGTWFNGIIGTGATFLALKIQIWCAIGYLIYIYVVVNFTDSGLIWAWASEIFYWIAIIGFCYRYLKSKNLLNLEF